MDSGKNVFITGKKKDPTKQIGFKQGCPYQIQKHFVKSFVNIPLYGQQRNQFVILFCMHICGVGNTCSRTSI